MSVSSSRSPIRTLLVDDEEIALYRLAKALEAFPDIHVVGEARDAHTAVQQINDLKPDLVFLDIRMPGGSGFDVLDQLQYTPLIVFVTAYEEYAVKAFEEHSLDYLLKPVTQERLARTIERVLQYRKPAESDILEEVKQLIREKQKEEPISTIPVRTGNKIQLIQVAEVCFFTAEDKYVKLHTQQEEKLVEYPLSWLQDRLPTEFIRIHRSYIVNKLMIREIHKYFKGTYMLVMNDAKATKLKSAYGYSDAIKAKLLLP